MGRAGWQCYLPGACPSFWKGWELVLAGVTYHFKKGEWVLP